MEQYISSAFGNEVSLNQAQVVIIPVPWEVTASYGSGTSEGPELIRRASFQLDFFQKDKLKTHNHLIHFQKEDLFIKDLNKQALSLSKEIKNYWSEDKVLNFKEKMQVEKVNKLCEQMVNWVYKKSEEVCLKEKIPVVVGGDHSVSEGILKFIGEKYKGNYGILHIDAHPDLRFSYQGFKHSHASVMNNAISQNPAPKKLIQVGIRDFSKEEYEIIETDPRIICYYDEDLFARLFSGENWLDLCKEIISLLPSQVYISLDVDGLSWESSMGTGTPVPGGLSFNQSLFLLKELERQNKKIIGFDVVETSCGEKGKTSLTLEEWSGNVSARLIYYLSGLALNS